MWKLHLKAISTLVGSVAEELMLRTCTFWGLRSSCSPVPRTDELQGMKVHEMCSDIHQTPFLSSARNPHPQTAMLDTAAGQLRRTRTSDSKSHSWPQPQHQHGCRLEIRFQVRTLWLLWKEVVGATESTLKHPKAASCCPAACQPRAGLGPRCAVCGWHLKSWSRNHGTKGGFCFRPRWYPSPLL